MKALLFIACLIATSLFAQEPKFIESTKSVSTYRVDFDQDGNLYFVGYVSGRVTVNGTVKDYPKTQRCLAKIDKNNNFKWIAEFDKTPRDMKVEGDKVIVLEQTRETNDDERTYDLNIHQFDLNGKKLSKKTITSISGDKYDIFSDGRIENGYLVSWSNVEGEGKAKLDGVALSKSLYSLDVIQMHDLEGNKIWSYNIEGGVGGFTELRMQDIIVDKDNNTYVACYFGAKANTGVGEQLTTEILYAKPQKLFVEGVFLLKIDAKGNGVKSEKIADYHLDIEQMTIDEDGNLYIVGYHKGNNTYAAKQTDGKPYRGLIFKGKSFEYTEAQSQKGPEEDGIVAKLDKDWNLLWMKNLTGESTKRVEEIALVGDKVYISGLYSKTVDINGKTYKAHPEDKGYSDGYVCSLTKDGEWNNDVITFNAVHSNFSTVWADKSGNIVIIGTVKEGDIIINGTSYKRPAVKYSSFTYRP